MKMTNKGTLIKARDALSECLGRMTGGMDGVWRGDANPIESALSAIEDIDALIASMPALPAFDFDIIDCYSAEEQATILKAAKILLDAVRS